MEPDVSLVSDLVENGQTGHQNYVLMATNSNGNSTLMALSMAGVGGKFIFIIFIIMLIRTSEVKVFNFLTA